MALSRIATALRPAVRRTCAHFHTAAPHFTARATAPAFNDAADAADAAVAERAAQLAQLFDDPMSLHALDKAFGKAADAERENQKERKVDENKDILRLKAAIPFATSLDGTVVSLTRDVGSDGARVTVQFDLDDGEDAPMYEKMLGDDADAFLENLTGNNDDVLSGDYDDDYDDEYDLAYDSDDSDDERDLDQIVKDMGGDMAAVDQRMLEEAGLADEVLDPNVPADVHHDRNRLFAKAGDDAILDAQVIMPFRLLFRLPGNRGELVAHCKTTVSNKYRVEATVPPVRQMVKLCAWSSVDHDLV